jgi:hypothetical protein
LRQELAKDENFRVLAGISDRELGLLIDASAVISKRTGRLVGALVLAAAREMDPHLTNDHKVAIDGSVYEKHPKMKQYILALLS